MKPRGDSQPTPGPDWSIGCPDSDCERIADKCTGRTANQTSAAQPLHDFVIAKPQPPVRVVLAKLFQLVEREVNHGNLGAGTHRPGGFPNDRRRVVGEVQHLVDRHHVKRVRPEWQTVHVPMTNLAM